MTLVAGAVREYSSTVVGRLRYLGPCCQLLVYSTLFGPDARSGEPTHKPTVPVLFYAHLSGTPRMQRREGKEKTSGIGAEEISVISYTQRRVELLCDTLIDNQRSPSNLSLGERRAQSIGYGGA